MLTNFTTNEKTNFLNSKNFTLSYSNDFNDKSLTSVKKKFINKFLKNRPKVKNNDQFPRNKKSEKAQYSMMNLRNKYDKALLHRMVSSFKHKTHSLTSSFFKFHLFDVNFLKKEKMYTKLKYSRVPQYDIVSGASAALLAGFLGFLICEKFGFELLDSGDFYFFFMYVVFLIFCSRLLVKLITLNVNIWSIFSFKWFMLFYRTIFNCFFFKKLNNK